MLAFEYPGGWNDVKGSTAVTVLQFLMGGGGSFSAGGPGRGGSLQCRSLPALVMLSILASGPAVRKNIGHQFSKLAWISCVSQFLIALAVQTRRFMHPAYLT